MSITNSSDSWDLHIRATCWFYFSISIIYLFSTLIWFLSLYLRHGVTCSLSPTRLFFLGWVGEKSLVGQRERERERESDWMNAEKAKCRQGNRCCYRPVLLSKLSFDQMGFNYPNYKMTWDPVSHLKKRSLHQECPNRTKIFRNNPSPNGKLRWKIMRRQIIMNHLR